MADVQKYVEIVFGAVDNTASVFQSVGGGVSNFANAAQDAIAPLNAVADAIKLMDTAIVGVGLAFGGLALQKAGEFYDQMAQIGILSSNTKEQVAGFSTQVLQYGANSTASLNDITGALKDAIGSGVEWTKSLEFLAAAENLSLGASGSLNEATNVLIGTMNAYGAKTNEAAHYTDILMQAVLYGKTTLPELESSLANVTATAAAAKVPFSEVGAALAALTASGLPTAQAVTALNQVITQMITPTDESAKVAKQLGINFSATALQTDGLAVTLKKVYDATGGNVTQMGTLFGSVDALKGALILGADSAGTFKTALDGMKTGAGAAAEAANTLREQWGVATQQMQNALDIFMISVGQKLNEDGEFAGILAELKNIFSRLTFAVNAGAFDQVLDVFQAGATRLSAFLAGIAEALPAALEQVDFGKFTAAAQGLFDVLGHMFDGVDLTTLEGLADVIQLVVDSIANLINMGTGIVDVWIDMAKEAEPVVRAFADMSKESAISKGELLGIADVVDKVLGAVGGLGKGLEAVGTGMELLAGAQIGKLLLGLDGLLIKIPGASTAATILGTALGAGGVATGLVGAAGAAGYAVGTVLSSGIDWVVSKLSGSNSLGGLIYDLTHKTEDLSQAQQPAASAIKATGDAAGVAAITSKELTDTFGAQARNVEDVSRMHKLLESSTLQSAAAAGEARLKTELLAAAQKAAKAPTQENKEAFYALADSYEKTATMGGHAAEASKVIRDAMTQIYPPVQQVNKDLKTSSGVMDELASKTNLTNKELIELAKVTKDAEVKLEQIASNERIKNIEAKVKLDIAEVEANAKIAVAILDNLARTYEADTSLIGELSKQLTTGYSEADKFRMKLIEDADQRIEEMHKAQLKQIDAYVEYMQAKTAAVNAGNPIMTINADGLQTHLEGMMWEVFRQIQVKMAQDGGDIIVGGLPL